METIKLTDENILLKSDTRADIFLSSYFNISRSTASGILAAGKVTINGKNQKPSYKLKNTDIIEYDPRFLNNAPLEILPQNIKLDIKFEDDNLLVINKQKGILTHPTAHQRKGTLVNALLYHCGDNLSNKDEPLRRGIVHRLDKNTAGLMLAAKTDAAAALLQKQIKEKSATRKYLAIALGVFDKKEGAIDKPLAHYMSDSVKMQIAKKGEGKDALTYYKVLKQFEGAALVELELKTGRTHQIRAHMASINHPLFNDTLYGSKGHTIEKYRNIKTNEQVLISYYLSFTHPKNNEIMTFELKYDDWDSDFKKVLGILEREKR